MFHQPCECLLNELDWLITSFSNREHVQLDLFNNMRLLFVAVLEIVALPRWECAFILKYCLTSIGEQGWRLINNRSLYTIGLAVQVRDPKLPEVSRLYHNVIINIFKNDYPQGLGEWRPDLENWLKSAFFQFFVWDWKYGGLNHRTDLEAWLCLAELIKICFPKFSMPSEDAGCSWGLWNLNCFIVFHLVFL